jgi:hypothetical protein
VPLFSTAVPETALTLVSVSVSPLRPGVIRRNVEINRLAGYPRCGRTRSGPGGSFALASTTVPLLTARSRVTGGCLHPRKLFLRQMEGRLRVRAGAGQAAYAKIAGAVVLSFNKTRTIHY